MRKRTIKRRLRLSQISDKNIDMIFERMYGIRDRRTFRGEGRYLWVKVVKHAYRQQEKEDKKAGIVRLIKMPKETFSESLENLGLAWRHLVNSVLKEVKNTFSRKKTNVKSRKEKTTQRK